MKRQLRLFLTLVLATVCANPASAQNAAFDTLHVAGGTFLEKIAQAQGFFKKFDLKVDVKNMSAEEAGKGIQSGAIDIADHGADNAVALVESTGRDLVIVMGVNSIPVLLVAQPGTPSLDALKNTTILVDDPRMENALVL